MSLNKVFLQGRLGADPELKVTPNGVEVASVSIAVDRDRKDADGNRQSDWVNIVAWRGTAKFLADYFTKGRVLIVDGRLQTRNYTDKEGNKRTAFEVVADNIYFGDSKREGDHGGGYAPAPSYGGNYSAAQSYAQQGGGFAELPDEDDGELPF